MSSHWWDHYLEGPYSVGNKGSWLYVELYSDFTVTVLFLNEGWSWQLYATFAVAKRTPEKKFRLVRDSNPWPLYRCSALGLRVRILYKPEFFSGVLLATAKVAYVTTMIILHLILLSAVHIYDLYTFKTCTK